MGFVHFGERFLLYSIIEKEYSFTRRKNLHITVEIEFICYQVGTSKNNDSSTNTSLNVNSFSSIQ